MSPREGERQGAGRRASVAVTALLSVLAMAPTVGDAGGCGRTPTELDRDRYASVRKSKDCQKCQECGLGMARCARACDPKALPDIVLPPTCHPLVHDGEVCIRALEAASCKTFATYVDDDAPATPSECDICRISPNEPAPALGDTGLPEASAP